MSAEIGIKEKEILDRFGQAIVKRYVAGLEKVRTTGASQKSIAYRITPTGLQMIAGAWFPAIDFGRSKSRAKSPTGFYEALQKWIVKKDDFKLGHKILRQKKESYNSSTEVNLANATRSLQFKINKYGTKGNIFAKDRRILSSIDTSDLEKQLAEDLGREWLTKITSAIVYDSRFQFIEVKLTKKA